MGISHESQISSASIDALVYHEGRLEPNKILPEELFLILGALAEDSTLANNTTPDTPHFYVRPFEPNPTLVSARTPSRSIPNPDPSPILNTNNPPPKHSDNNKPPLPTISATKSVTYKFLKTEQRGPFLRSN